jgi:hypothetical protein
MIAPAPQKLSGLPMPHTAKGLSAPETVMELLRESSLFIYRACVEARIGRAAPSSGGVG